jgi:hypothetical protein
MHVTLNHLRRSPASEHYAIPHTVALVLTCSPGQWEYLAMQRYIHTLLLIQNASGKLADLLSV